jgi:hypothetical protein
MTIRAQELLEPEERLAIIRDPKFGVNDRDEVVLQFQAYLSEALASQQQLSAEEGIALLRAYGVSDVSHLAGKPVWMDVSRPGVSLFKRAWRYHP